MAGLMGNIADIGKKILISVGKNNKPTYTVMTIAAANGIFKPISSLTDKKEKPEARKYAALREFATECVAVPTFVIPAVCSVALKILDKITGKNTNKKENQEPAKLDITSNAPEMQVHTDIQTKFGQNMYRPNMSTFLNKGGLKI